MATDPFVAPRLEDRPRASTPFPPAKAWSPTRVGDLDRGQPTGPLLGNPGPDIGYALRLAEGFAERIQLAPHEHAADAVAVGAELAMRRCARIGRAPVAKDLEWAFSVLGYLGSPPADFVAWRKHRIEGAHHEYLERRALVNAVRPEVLDLGVDDVQARLSDWQSLFTLAD